MKALTLLLLPAVLFAGEARYARLGEFQGQVEVQLTAADPWMPAERNLPLAESAWVRTGATARLEIELDDGSAWRLGPNSLGEISDYTVLSTGQRITLLSLDHGMAYFSGEPRSNDVLMLVAPGAQVTLGQGARVRLLVQPDWSQFSVLEGMVRFSSPSAEMGLREGQTARAEPANPQRFFIDPQVIAIDLDRWSEALDKAETAPASALHVTWRAGLVDLDNSGDWVQTQDSGVVWKPKVDETWRPYQRGRWRYFETLGYTWVSDDLWGWMPYHNGRWQRTDDLGWVWQPSVSSVFKPGEVYWLGGGLAGPGLAGWGPLAPGEQWATAQGTIPIDNPPRSFAAGMTTYAAFQQDARTIDPAGFPAPAPDQLKAVAFAPAPPSPAFLAARLEATRPVLRVGSTRVKLMVPGVTLDDSTPPPSAVMTDPPLPPQPPAVIVSDTPPGGGSLPDGVYPVPAVAVPVVEVPVVVNPPDHPSYSRPNGGYGSQGQTGSGVGRGTPGGQSGQQSGAGTPAAASQVTHSTGSQPVHEHAQPTPPGSQGNGSSNPPSSVTSHPTGGGPVHEHPPATTTPTAPAATPKVEMPKTDTAKSPDKKLQARVPAPGEFEVYNQAIREADPRAALRDLDIWAARFPKSDFADERQYLYLHVYSLLSRPEKVLEVAAPLVSAGVRNRFDDPTKVLQILFDSAASLQKLSTATAPQVATAQQAARQLLDFLPEYFAPKHKPAVVSDAAWQSAREQLETSAKQTLAKSGMALRAGYF